MLVRFCLPIFRNLNKKSNKMLNNSSELQNECKSYFSNCLLDFSFKQWLIDDGAYVQKGDNIYEYSKSVLHQALLVRNNISAKAIITKHKAEKSGYIDFYFKSNVLHIQKNQLMYIIRDKDEVRVDRKFINIPLIINDDFNNSIRIKWERVSSSCIYSEGISLKSEDLQIDLVFTFNFEIDSDYIIFHFKPKQIKPKLNDKVFFLFDNKEIIEFELNNNPSSRKNIIGDKILEFRSSITKSELDLFSNSDLKKWKISLDSERREILGGEIGGEKNYQSKSNLNLVIKKFSNDYIATVINNIKDYKPLEIRLNDGLNEVRSNFCYVYLMHDTVNGYYKIGISNNPAYREKTLQSEKPTIEMVISKKFPIRKIAESIEKSLHQVYSEKRIRGEWFELSLLDVEHIIESLK